MTKGKLIDIVLTDDEKRCVDTALPQNFVDDCINLLNIDPRPSFVWSYLDNSVCGKPLNLAELYVERYLDIHAVNGNVIDANQEMITEAINILNKVTERQKKKIQDENE